MLYAIVGMLVIILDQGVKYWITSNFMVDSVTQPLIPGVISLVRVHNDGAASASWQAAARGFIL